MMFKAVLLDYDFSVVLGADYSAPGTSCIQHQVYELTDIHDMFGGFPDTYCLANTTIHQLWWTRDDLDFDKLGHQLGIEVVSISSIMQPPGNVVPYHRDTFFKIKQAHPDRPETCVRANVFLENNRLGHMLQLTLDNRHITASEWNANTGYMFDDTVLHLSCNAGMEPKYTLQISGLLLQ